MRYVGSRVRRLEDRRLLTGQGRFIADHRRPGALWARFVRSTVAHARICSIDPDEARQAPRVVCVLTGADLDGLVAPLAPPQRDGLHAPAHPALAVEEVRFVGDPVALVVATDEAAAVDAAELVCVDYEPLAVLATMSDALATGAPAIFDDVPGNVMWSGSQRWGDVDAALARADHHIRETFIQHRQAGAPLEGRGGLADYDPGTDTLTYTISHQNPHAMRMHLAAILGMPASKVTVRLHDTGGSFGLKSHPSREDVAVCAAARLLGQPVRWVEERGENLTAAGHAREEHVTIEAGVTGDGVLIALRARLSMDHGAYPLLNIPLSLFANIVKVLLPGTLRLAHYEFEGRVVATNKASYVAYRGPWEVETWVRERLLDRIGRELGIDPIEVRHRNLLPDEAFPCTMLTGPTLEHMTINTTLARARELAAYDEFRSSQADARAAGRLPGIGTATYLEPGPGPPDYGQALGFSYEQRSRQRARVAVEIDGSITVHTSQQPHGQSHETTLAQLVADELGVAPEQVRVVHGDTNLQPFNLVATGGSRSATLASGAVVGAAAIVRTKLGEVAAALLEANPADIELAGGVAFVRGSPDRCKSLGELGRLALLAPMTLPESLGPGLEATFDFETPSGGWTQSTHVCWVEIDAETGQVAIPRYLVVEDCGKMINADIVEGQIRGGIAQGIAAVLYEHAVYDDQGTLLTASLADYLVPSAVEVPSVEIEHLHGPVQGDIPYRGVGEGGAIGAPAALTNAIEDALAHLGVRITEQHLPPMRISQLLGAAVASETSPGSER